MKNLLLGLFAFSSILTGEIVETVYGPFDVQEPVLLDLINCPQMQRLKHVHQYGVVPYIEECEEYNRYDHSLGVWALLRENECSLEEQIAGLLHDVSHTAFSHFGDYFFRYFSDESSYQDSVHDWYLHASGIDELLRPYDIAVEDVLAKSGRFHATARSLPDLSADRAEYNIQGAYRHGSINEDELHQLFADLEYRDGHWSLSDSTLAGRIGRFSMDMSINQWSGPYQSIAHTLLAEAVELLVQEGVVCSDDIHFGVDNELWKILENSTNPEVQLLLDGIITVRTTFQPCSRGDAEQQFHIKCRAIDPMMRTDSGLVRLSELLPEYAVQLEATRERAKLGWYLRVCPSI